MLNDPVMLRIAEDRFWLSTADGDMYLWAKGVSAFSGHDVTVTTPHVYPLQVQGPRSADIVSTVFGDDVLDLRYYRWMYASVDGIDVVISRTGYSSELGFEVYLLGTERGDELWETLMTAGKPYGISPGSPNRIRRIEGGVLDYASDITPDENPLELGLDRLIAWDTEFLGKAALREGARRRCSSTPDRPLPRRPCLAEEQRAPLARDERQHEGRFCHERRAFPRLDRNIAFAMIDVPFDANDTLLTVETVEGARSAERTTLPFIASPPEKTKKLR